MTIKRREFLRRFAVAAGAGMLPLSMVRPAYGATPDRFLVTISATGGWDPTSLMDPKGNAPRSDGLGPINNYAASNIRSAGNLLYAPYSDQVTAPDPGSAGHIATFFEKYHQQLLVINGIDTQTNGHDSGRRFVWSGKLEEGYPSVAALAAAPFAEQPMAFISNGGYDFTAALVAPVRTSGSGTFQQMALPNSLFPSNADFSDVSYFSSASYDAIKRARDARLGRLQAQESLPRRLQQMAQLETVRSNDVELQQLLGFLPEVVSDGLSGQAEIAAAAFASGLAVSANLTVGGFDTHGDHDRDHSDSITELLLGIDHLWQQIETLGLADKVTVVVGSDFGRTPFYNTGAGKDHWNVTSVMAMGAGITGNRTIGSTDENFEVHKVNPSTLEADSNGIIMTPQHIHRSLRDFLGISSTLDNLYPLEVERLDLFA